jgi:hypothetical protein
VERRPVSRAAAIVLLRNALKELTTDERSLCLAAAERGIFCHGFRAFSEPELRDRITGGPRNAELSRQEVEKLANRWMLNRQEAAELPLACDVEREERDLCGGWEMFSDLALERFCHDLLNADLVIRR